MSAWETLMSFFDNTFQASTFDIACDRIKHLNTKLLLEVANDVISVSDTERIFQDELTYPFSIRETPPKEVWTGSTNGIFYCISKNRADEYRVQQS